MESQGQAGYRHQPEIESHGPDLRPLRFETLVATPGQRDRAVVRCARVQRAWMQVQHPCLVRLDQRRGLEASSPCLLELETFRNDPDLTDSRRLVFAAPFVVF